MSKLILLASCLMVTAQAMAGGGGIEHFNCNARISPELSASIIVYGDPYSEEIGMGVEVLPDPTPDPSKAYYYTLEKIENGENLTKLVLVNSQDKPLGEKLVLVFKNDSPLKALLVVTTPHGKTKTVPMDCEFIPS